jgi:hypothetical protein
MAGIALTKLKALKRADLLITRAYVNGRWIEADDTSRLWILPRVKRSHM